MCGRVQGRVALVTGAARGQGRSHAVRLAEEGADVIAVDVVRDVETVPYPGATPDDLEQTAALVEATGRRVMTAQVDVRDHAALAAAVTRGVDVLGRLDVVVANAGVLGSPAPLWQIPEEQWRVTLDVDLTGVFHTVKASVPHVLRGGRGGSVILVSSAAGLKGVPNYGDYAAAKHGVLGIARTLAVELAPYSVRVNSLHPGSVDTTMILNEATISVFTPGDSAPADEQVRAAFRTTNLLPVPWVDAADISNAVLWLASDESRYVTGITLPVDAGMGAK